MLPFSSQYQVVLSVYIQQHIHKMLHSPSYSPSPTHKTQVSQFTVITHVSVSQEQERVKMLPSISKTNL